MLDFSLSLLSNSYRYQLKNPKNPTVKEFYEMEYAPSNIEKLLIFSVLILFFNILNFKFFVEIKNLVYFFFLLAINPTKKIDTKNKNYHTKQF